MNKIAWGNIEKCKSKIEKIKEEINYSDKNISNILSAELRILMHQHTITVILEQCVGGMYVDTKSKCNKHIVTNF